MSIRHCRHWHQQCCMYGHVTRRLVTFDYYYTILFNILLSPKSDIRKIQLLFYIMYIRIAEYYDCSLAIKRITHTRTHRHARTRTPHMYARAHAHTRTHRMHTIMWLWWFNITTTLFVVAYMAYIFDIKIVICIWIGIMIFT